MRLPFDDQFELAGKHVDDLLVGMLVLRKRRAGIDVDPRVRHAIRVHEPGAQAGKDFTDGNAFKLNERHASTPPRRPTAAARHP